MKIGIDFGTSYSSAAVFRNGQIEHIMFDGQPQFRTAVFFPDRAADLSRFELTSLHEQEVSDGIRSAKAAYARRLSDYNKDIVAIEMRARAAARLKKPMSAQDKEERRAMIAKPFLSSDQDLRESAINSIKRRWLSDETAKAKEADIRLDAAIFGEEAINALFIYESGRLIQSPKSMLGFRLEKVQRGYITSIVTRILKHIREQASLQLGVQVTQATLGRPVKFRSSLGPDGGLQAISMLTEAATAAGFRRVDFLHEPSAAAVGYHSSSTIAHQALIIDIGGGTTDIALAEVGAGGPQPHILKTWGEPKGGTDVDLGLSLRSVMPLFGKGVCSELLAPVFMDAASVSDLNRQKSFRKHSFPRTPLPYAARLAALQNPGIPVRLNSDVEKLKIELSRAAYSERSLDYIETGLVARANETHLALGAESFMRTFQQLLAQVSTEIKSLAPVLFLTGGMSRAPYVVEAVRQAFPQCEMVPSEASLGVVDGLSVYASLTQDS
ncbi:Hsp70 family protein [Pseudomonas sp. ANT_J12]|uniref:Hsp70 family protein n=1 Tax=Pseudomonas sp. ANT_J12 TaxID=2597351 RepID=UPI0011F11CBE|nr:Hsp70 family protein [Pseudomonas sp. ANT_J12]KAA0995599.1 Hsp70 family protein [Pseudomonas sp. ANT_J12]